ncbi:VOC family protein [Methylobacterium sp. J-076]|uniref:VOC family protein n=1 Tax=Methylobacterium sp. J-076 TaxID=2836655 RepID=UPI001FB8DE66|nr:VOC family protein [Methylobacterium sp. J-076]MCJ2013063.1 VOC family protein [Methylobacterium sp. J-076]
MSGIGAILRFDRTVADLDATEAFYRDGLGFVREGPPEPLPAAEAEALGLAGRRGLRLRMALGRQRVAFLSLTPPGAPYPAGADATDPVFQHLAIPVRDMGAAFARLESLAPAPISRGGPQILPPASGGVSAYKFRDPDGHPLELIHFPGGEPAARWADAPGLFLGIDHSAITVTDLDGAIGFLTGLGLTVSERGLNRGPEQARLDGLPDPVVDVVALSPPEPTPHVELLHYRAPAPSQPTRTSGPADRASTRFVVSSEDPAALARSLPGARLSSDGSVCYLAGPDGHGFLILRRG